MKDLLEESGCLRGGCNAIIPVYRDLIKAPQSCKMPGKVLEFLPEQKGRTLLSYLLKRI